MKKQYTFPHSIRWRAAILTSTLVAVVLTALIWYVFARVSTDLVTGGIDRAQTAASVLAGQTAQTTQQGLARLQDLGRGAAIRDYLRAPNDANRAAAVQTLTRVGLQGQDGVIQLWDAAKQPRLQVKLPDSTTIAFPPDTLDAAPGLQPLLTLGGEAYSRAVVDVPGDGGDPRLGLIVLTRLIRSPAASALLKNVVGNAATVLIGNQSPGAPAVWTDLERVVAAPLVDTQLPAHGEFRSAGGEREIGASASITGTPWVLLVEFPRSVVLASAWQLLQRLIGVGIVFLLVAMFAASQLSRRVTQPLADLTTAVQALEQGDFSRRVLTSGRDEVGQLSAAFNAMARQIESGRHSLELRAEELAASRAVADDANRAKDDFLAVLSHELRTPLSAVLGWCHLLRSGALPQPERDRAIEVIERNAHAQLRLVDDLLDISRILVGKFALDLRPSDALSVVRDAMESNRPAAQKRNIALVWEPSPVSNGSLDAVVLDPDRIRQAVDNLVANAIKFTPRGGAVHVGVGLRNGEIEISVRDDGEGIAPDALPAIFDRLRQGDRGSKRRHTGLGLGLAIVRQIVELHHGTVAAASPGIGRGSTFRIRLPIRPANTTADVLRAVTDVTGGWAMPTGRSVQGIRVLVVEDADDSRDFLRELLTQAGAIVTTAPGAAEAIEWLRANSVDVIVSDVEMPGQDGHAMLRAIRQSATLRTRHVPAIALSAYASSQDRTRSLAAGYQVHLTKPVMVDEFLATVHALVAPQSKSEDALAAPRIATPGATSTDPPG
jgi:signal transduction histidine kinase/ActR/RegA family two-component response regulator